MQLIITEAYGAIWKCFFFCKNILNIFIRVRIIILELIRVRYSDDKFELNINLTLIFIGSHKRILLVEFYLPLLGFYLFAKSRDVSLWVFYIFIRIKTSSFFSLQMMPSSYFTAIDFGANWKIILKFSLIRSTCFFNEFYQILYWSFFDLFSTFTDDEIFYDKIQNGFLPFKIYSSEQEKRKQIYYHWANIIWKKKNCEIEIRLKKKSS